MLFTKEEYKDRLKKDSKNDARERYRIIDLS